MEETRFIRPTLHRRRNLCYYWSLVRSSSLAITRKKRDFAAGEMENFAVSMMEQEQLYPRAFTSLKVDPSFKVDEGYSEDSRSLDDHDFPIKLETNTVEAAIPLPTMASLPEGIMALSESERSGNSSRANSLMDLGNGLTIT